jgi:hypothetical protein
MKLNKKRILKNVAFLIIIYLLFLRDNDNASYRFAFIAFNTFATYGLFCSDLHNDFIKKGKLQYQLKQLNQLEKLQDRDEKDNLIEDIDVLNSDIEGQISLFIIISILNLAVGVCF